MKPLAFLKRFFVSLVNHLKGFKMQKQLTQTIDSPNIGAAVLEVRTVEIDVSHPQVLEMNQEPSLLGSLAKIAFSESDLSLDQKAQLRRIRDDLISRITPENLHSFVDYGDPVGEEML